MIYEPPKLLQSPKFHPKQNKFWMKLNDWFAQFDEVPMRLDGIPIEFHSAMLATHISRVRAFRIVAAMQANEDTEGFPKGVENADERVASEKNQALREVRWTGKVNVEFVSNAIHQAALRNDVKFFRASLPNALKATRKPQTRHLDDYPGFVGGRPKLPGDKNCKSPWLAEMMVSFWCGRQFWPCWAHKDLPPFCILKDGAIAEILSAAFENIPDLTSEEAVIKCRERYGLTQFTSMGQISSVLVNPDIRFKTDI